MFTSRCIGKINGKEITEFYVKDTDGYSFSCIDYGAAMTSLVMPDKFGEASNVLLSYDHPEDYAGEQVHFLGKAIGRVAGRITDGTFELNGTPYQLSQNEGTTTLHGGKNGFGDLWWNVKAHSNGIEFYREMTPDEDTFPGTLKTSIIYKWGNHHQLHIYFTGCSNGDTLYNPTIHNYFNLNGETSSGLSDHCLQVYSSKVQEVTEKNLPTGKLVPVEGSLFDFQKPQFLSRNLELLREKGYPGYDHAFYVENYKVAELANKKCGRKITFYSDRNALIVYTLNGVLSTQKVHQKTIRSHMGIALEPQTLPDAIHYPQFGDIRLRSGQKQTYHMVYELSVEKNE